MQNIAPAEQAGEGGALHPVAEECPQILHKVTFLTFLILE